MAGEAAEDLITSVRYVPIDALKATCHNCLCTSVGANFTAGNKPPRE